MKFTIICSTLDKASMNIKSKLLENFNFDKKDSITLNGHDVNIHTIDSESIHFEEAEKKIDTNFFIFASKHQSKSGEKTLSVHFPGNFHTNDYGGQKNKMCGTSSGFLKESFINLNKLNTLSEFKVTLEATHHGPYIKKPCIFIEIGSSDIEWQNNDAGKIIAKTIMKTITNFTKKTYETAICFGGSHYCTGFNKILINSEIAFGHICPKYQVENINLEVIKEMIDSSLENINFALFDWKGLTASQKEKLKSIFEKLDIPIKRTKEFKQ